MKTSHGAFYFFGVMIIVLIVVAFGMTAVTAQQLPFEDGRINQFAFFGGDSLYCVDVQYTVTEQLPDEDNDGGFRLLNSTGQELWFIPGDDVTAALNQTGDGVPVLIATGQGSFGETNLYVNRQANGSPLFIFQGFDDQGKPNSFEFGGCAPQASDVGTSPTLEPIVPTPTPTKCPPRRQQPL